jgi:hypothetical protein
VYCYATVFVVVTLPCLLLLRYRVWLRYTWLTWLTTSTSSHKQAAQEQQAKRASKLALLQKRTKRECSLPSLVAKAGPPPNKSLQSKVKLPTSKVLKSFPVGPPVAPPVASPPPRKKHKNGTTVKTPSPSAKEIQTVTPSVTQDHSSLSYSIQEGSKDDDEELALAVVDDEELALAVVDGFDADYDYNDLLTQVQGNITLEQQHDTLDHKENMAPSIKNLQKENDALTKKLYDCEHALTKKLYDCEHLLENREGELNAAKKKLSVMQAAGGGIDPAKWDEMMEEMDELKEKLKTEGEFGKYHSAEIKKYKAEIATLKEQGEKPGSQSDPEELINSQKEVAFLKIQLNKTLESAATLQKNLNEALAKDVGGITVEEVLKLKKELANVKLANKAAKKVLEDKVKSLKDLRQQLAARPQEAPLVPVDPLTLDWDKDYKEWTKSELYTGIQVAVDDFKETKKENEKLREQCQQLMDALKSTGKAAKVEMVDSVKQAARDALRDVVWRKTKLVTSRKEQEVEKLTGYVYDLIVEEKKVSPRFTKAEFHRIYQKDLMKHFSNIRSQTQTAVTNACFGE